MNVFLSNFKFAMRYNVEQQSSAEWLVSEMNMLFVVTLSSPGVMACSCFRYFDEVIVKVIDYARMNISPTSLISHIYGIARFVEAFPDKLPFKAL